MFVSLTFLLDQLVSYNLAAEPSTWTSEQALGVVAVASRIKNAAGTLEAIAAARVAETGAWRNSGAPTPADWFAGQTGSSTNQAKERLETATALNGGLDATAERAKAGKLSAEQAAAITDAATKNPDAEDELLATADRESLNELRDKCKTKKREADTDPDATHRRLRSQRSLRRYCDKEGAAHLHWNSTADDASEIDTTLDAIIDELFETARKDNRNEPRDAYAADALTEMARRARGGPAGPTKSAKAAAKYLGLIRADLSALVRGNVQPGELCEITGIGPIPVSRARELLGESILKLVLTSGRDANVTHLGRGANATQRIALLWRSPICSVAGCSRRARLENDHITTFAEVRETSLDNLEPKCEHHHDLKTYQGWEKLPDTGRQPMIPPEDPRHPRYRPPPEVEPESPGHNDQLVGALLN